MSIEYRINHHISAQQFVELLRHSTLAERRPVDDPDCMQGMVENGNLSVTAWSDDQLVGIARSVTDFHYCCYLSDLAVHRDFQRLGIGRRLQSVTQQQLGPRCKLILLAAPAANDYYPLLGYSNNPRCWILEPDQVLE
ncbi:Acetyltransferase (GNAT) domain-containing protein [Microbulbifer donghaiensis]|uniref:Acetyltransferase (GNAT) domain-containing protein n=1 Tax=Microbulbifer donghaiensis TaxID=494016 RepID=A0A1M4VZL4_9GAMM|nr:GNAT family N-acetyltransferase [Microbulbifer donghaiensis]SHE74323.1 Acetyltransferase (GNAT) domain-containing protein [Microbulbifer donghaiensis]